MSQDILSSGNSPRLIALTSLKDGGQIATPF